MTTVRSCYPLLGLLLAGTVGCVTTQSSSQSTTKTGTQTSAQKPAEAKAQPTPCKTGLAKIAVGMSEKEVHDLLGRPGYVDRRPTGKEFIPFYHGSDYVHTIEGYKGEGRVEFNSDHTVEGVECDASEAGRR